MRILLTGAKGQVGQEIVALAKSFPGELFAFSKTDLDITDPLQIERAIKTTSPTLLINAAAYTAVDKAEQEVAQAYAINSEGVKQLALGCKRFNLPLIHISTDYVFDGSKPTAYLEEDVRAPLSVYGASKAQGEQVLQNEWEKHVILRTSWVFGKQGPNFVKTILKLALKQKELRVVSDQKGCPTAASDLAQALLKIAFQINQGQPKWGIFHYCGVRETSWFEFAKLIVDYGKTYFPFKLETIQAIETADFPTPALRPKNSVLNRQKIENNYGLKPSEWEQALESLLKYLDEKGELREYISS